MATAILNRPTLVLNRNWQPVGVAPVAKSLIKVWNEAAQIVDPADFQLYSWADWAQLTPADNAPIIRTRTLMLRVPEVIVLKSSSRLPSTRITPQPVRRRPGSRPRIRRGAGLMRFHRQLFAMCS